MTKKTGEGELLKTHPLLLLPDLSLRKPLTATVKRGTTPAVIGLCRTDHNKVSISNHRVHVVLDHDLGFASGAATGTERIHKQHCRAISHDVNRWHISQNDFVFRHCRAGVNPDASNPIAVTLRLSSGFVTIGIDHLLQQRT